MSPRNGVRTGTSPWTTDHTGDAPALPVLSPRLEWTSAALRRRRLPVRIRPGTLRARSSTSALAQASFARRSRRGRAGEPSKGSRLDVRRSRKAEIRGASPLGFHGPAVRLDGHSRPKRDGVGSNPAGATTLLETLRRYSSLVRRAAHRRLSARPHGHRGSNPRRLLRFGGVAQLGKQVRRRHLVCVHTRTEGRWLSRPGFESQRLHISSPWGRSSVAERYTRRRQLSFAREASRRLTVIA